MKTYDAYCQACGNKYKNTELRMRWDGKRVCDADWETRHPQDLLKIPRTEKPLPWVAPDIDGTSDDNIILHTGGCYNPSDLTTTGKRSCLTAPIHPSIYLPGNLLTSNAVTISAWIYYKAAARINNILRVGMNSSGGYLFRINGLGGLNFPEFYFSEGGRYYGVSTGDAFPENAWYHLAVKMVAGLVYFYIHDTSGNLLGTWGPLSPVDNGPVTTELNEVQVGGSYINNVLSERWDGKIDDIRVWNANRAVNLTGQTFLDNEAKDLTGSESGLLLYLKLDETIQAKYARCSKVGSAYGSATPLQMIQPDTFWPNTRDFNYFVRHPLGSTV